MDQTFLLLHTRQSLSIVAPSSIRYHHPSIVRGHHLTYLFVAVTSTNLVHRSLIRFERHQKAGPPSTRHPVSSVWTSGLARTEPRSLW